MYRTATKKCRRCGKVRSVGQFDSDSRSKDGLSPLCLSCEGRSPRNRSPWSYPGKLGAARRKKIFLRDRGRCLFCRKPVDPNGYTLHMLIPRRLGGSYLPCNLRVVHPRCPDRRKGQAARLAEELCYPVGRYGRERLKKRDKRKRRDRQLARAALKRATPEAPSDLTVKVIRDTRGRKYIKAPDGSVRRADKVNPEKLDWLAET